MDCKLIFIKRPHTFKDEFVNPRGNYSFNVQATCNSNEMFYGVECKWAGSVHDARIWRNSQTFGILNDNRSGAILLADKAYPWEKS